MRRTALITLTTLLLLAACTTAPEEAYTVTVTADGASSVLVLEDDVTVSDVLGRAGIALGELDRVNPPGFSRISEGLTITVVRVREETVIEDVVIPFERRTTRNDGLTAGETRLLQAGVNGIAEVTYRIIYENAVEIARSEIRRIVITEPQDELVMVGSQGELPSVTVDGSLFYLSGGNAWVIRQNSANRRPLTVDGRLDGRVFAVAPDGRALFTQTCEDADPDEGLCNTLWAAFDTASQEIESIELDVQNVLYADWAPGWERMIVYSTAEPRPGFPGWQANNDLWRAQISANGAAVRREELLEPSGGGIYGWYGTVFAFSPDGITLAWAQPDAVGVLGPPITGDEDATPTPPPSDIPPLPTDYERRTLLRFGPANAYDFVWVPSVTWSPDGSLIATTVHGAPMGAESMEDSPVFDLVIADAAGAYTVPLVGQAGMWSAAQFSGEQIAYLQAIDPLNSVASRYRLVIADRDGSNAQTVYPPETLPGLRAQAVAWSPDGGRIALVHQGDLYILDITTGLTQQLSGDGLSSAPVWRQ